MRCIICGKTIKEDDDYYLKLTQGEEKNYIHFECVDTLNNYKESAIANQPEYFEDYLEKIFENEDIQNINPSYLKSLLDDFVIGQDNAKTQLATAIYVHYKRIQANKITADEVEIEKSNVLMVGPSGSGKTWMIKVLAKKLGIPFITQDCTSITANGLNVI